MLPGAHAQPHVPCEQTVPGGHTAPHAPQFEGSLERSTQLPPQSARPGQEPPAPPWPVEAEVLVVVAVLVVAPPALAEVVPAVAPPPPLPLPALDDATRVSLAQSAAASSRAAEKATRAKRMARA